MSLLKNTPDLKNACRIGVIGGAFNPIHYGHLVAAEGARCEMDLDFVLFIPTGQPPHKASPTFSEHRYLMTVLAAADNPHFYTSRMELDRPGPSYTIDTLRDLKQVTNAELFFIAGADEIMQILTWKDAHGLLGMCRWIAAVRPGYDDHVLSAHIKHLTDTFGCQIDILKMPGFDISGTALRDLSRSDKPIKYMVPPAVERYVQELCLYLEPSPLYEIMHQSVAFKLSPKRYQHTLGVIETSILLAARHDVDMRKAYQAALLHDYAKELKEEEKLEMCKRYAIPLDDVQKSSIGLMHGQIGAEMARLEFSIEEDDILNAISYHTTGRAGMGRLECIIKIADNIEPNRPDYPGLEVIRRLALYNVNRATVAAIERDIAYTNTKGQSIHRWGWEALADLEENYNEN